VDFQPPGLGFRLSEQQGLHAHLLLQVAHQHAVALGAVGHHQIPDASAQTDHLLTPAACPAVRRDGLIPALGAALHLGREQNGVAGLDAGLGPAFPEANPPVVGSHRLVCAGEVQFAYAEGLDDPPRLGKAPKAVDHASEAVDLAME
jgi:hypothetical protein